MHMKSIKIFFSRRRRHTRFDCDWSSDVCSSDLAVVVQSERIFPFLPQTIAANFHRRGKNDTQGWKMRPGDLPNRFRRYYTLPECPEGEKRHQRTVHEHHIVIPGQVFHGLAQSRAEVLNFCRAFTSGCADERFDLPRPYPQAVRFQLARKFIDGPAFAGAVNAVKRYKGCFHSILLSLFSDI